MRTTLSLDDDVARLLNNESRRSGASFKQVVNHFLRLGLMASKQPSRKPFVVKPINLGLPPGLGYDNVEELLEFLEGPEYR
ncbi:MAG: CopG family transcriptional regulator [Terriglobales bacterium]